MVQRGNNSGGETAQPTVHVHTDATEPVRTSATRTQPRRDRNNHRATSPQPAATRTSGPAGSTVKATGGTATAPSTRTPQVDVMTRPEDLVPHYLIGELLADPTFDAATLYEAAAATVAHGPRSSRRRSRGASYGSGHVNDTDVEYVHSYSFFAPLLSDNMNESESEFKQF